MKSVLFMAVVLVHGFSGTKWTKPGWLQRATRAIGERRRFVSSVDQARFRTHHGDAAIAEHRHAHGSEEREHAQKVTTRSEFRKGSGELHPKDVVVLDRFALECRAGERLDRTCD